MSDSIITPPEPSATAGNKKPNLGEQKTKEQLTERLRELAKTEPDEIMVAEELHKLAKVYKGQGVGKRLVKGLYERASFEHRQEKAKPTANAKADEPPPPPIPPTKQQFQAQRIKRWLMRQGNVFPIFQKCLARTGYIANEIFSNTLLLSHTQRLLAQSICIGVYGPYAAGKSTGAEKGAEFLPPELMKIITDISPKGFFYLGKIAGKYFIFGEMNPAKEGEDDYRQCVMRQLISENKLRYVSVEKFDGGENKAVEKTTDGPAVIVFSTTTEPHNWEAQIRSRTTWLRADDSAKTTGAILDLVAARAKRPSGGRLPLQWLEGWRAFHRTLEALTVAIPFAEEIKPTSRKAAIRRIFNMLLDYIRASALLHQHIRKRNDKGEVVATRADYEIAYGLTQANAPRMARVISPESLQAFDEKIKPLLGQKPDGTHKLMVGPEIGKSLGVGRSQQGRFIFDCVRAGLLVFVDAAGRGNAKHYRLGAGEPESDELGLVPPSSVHFDGEPICTPFVVDESDTNETLTVSGFDDLSICTSEMQAGKNIFVERERISL